MFRLWIVHVVDFLRCLNSRSSLTNGHKRRLLLAHQRISQRLCFRSFHAVSYRVVTSSLKGHEETPIILFFSFLSFAATAPAQCARASSFKRFLNHTQRRTSGRVISSSQKPLLDNTQHSQQKDRHDPDGIRTHNLSRRTAADLRVRPRVDWDRSPIIQFELNKLFKILKRNFTFRIGLDACLLQVKLLPTELISSWDNVLTSLGHNLCC